MINSIITSHIGLAVHIANNYHKTNSYVSKDELVSEAMYAIIQAAHKAPTLLQENEITYWISSFIHRHCRNFLYKERKRLSLFKTNQLIRVRINHQSLIEVKENIDECITDEQEATIVRLRLLGYNDREIGNLLQRSTTYINRIRKEIRMRYDNLSTLQ